MGVLGVYGVEEMKRSFEEEGDLEVWLDGGRDNRHWGYVFPDICSGGNKRYNRAKWKGP